MYFDNEYKKRDMHGGVFFKKNGTPINSTASNKNDNDDTSTTTALL